MFLSKFSKNLVGKKLTLLVRSLAKVTRFGKIFTSGNFNKSPGTRAEADSRDSTKHCDETKTVQNICTSLR